MDPEAGPVEGVTSKNHDPGTTRNIEARNDTIAGVLNEMLEEGRLIRRRKGKQKVLWSLAEDGDQERMQSGEKPLKTGSRLSTGSQESKAPEIGSVDRKEKTCPVENQPVPLSPPIYARGKRFGDRFSTGAEKERKKQEAVNLRRDLTVKLNRKTDCRDGNDTEVCFFRKT